MNASVKGRLLGRRSLINRKSRCDVDEERWLLIPRSNSEISVEQTQVLDPALRRTLSSTRDNGFQTINRTCDNTTSCDKCAYAGIIAGVSDGVRPCLPSPTLMRRRNAICDEIEKRMVALPPGRTLRQSRVDMLRGIALTQFSLL